MKLTNQPTEAQVTSRARVWWKVIKQGNALYWKGTAHLDSRFKLCPVDMAYAAAQAEASGIEVVAKYSKQVCDWLEANGVPVESYYANCLKQLGVR